MTPLHQNAIVFNILSDNEKLIRINSMLRIFVSTPPDCSFAKELQTILDFYKEQSVLKAKDNKRAIEYDYNLYCKLVPYSVLAKELHQKLIILPSKAFDFRGEL